MNTELNESAGMSNGYCTNRQGAPLNEWIRQQSRLATGTRVDMKVDYRDGVYLLSKSTTINEMKGRDIHVAACGCQAVQCNMYLQ